MRPMRSPQNPDLAIDLGTAVARVGSLREASVAESPARIGSTPAVRNGAVVEVEMASEILRHLFRRFQNIGWRGVRALACAPSDATETELLALEIAVRGAGVEEVCIVPEPLAAAIGAGADVGAEQASMVIDFGEGVTDCAVLGEGRILASVATRGGCCALRAGVMANVARETGLELGDAEAERLVRHVGLPQTGCPRAQVAMAWAHAAGSTLPRRHPIPASLVADAVEGVSGTAIEAAAAFTATLDPRRLNEIAATGVLLTGGGALIPGMQARFGERLGLPVVVARSPLDSVINGARELLDVAADAGLWE
jgi:rod shape-determining protein MreB and related proteins